MQQSSFARYKRLPKVIAAARYIGWALFLLLSLLLPGAQPAASADFNPDDVLRGPLRNALVHLTVNGRTQSGTVAAPNLGTAFFISGSGYALTAAHLFYQDRKIESGNRLIDAPLGQTFIEGRIGSSSESPKTFQLVQIYADRDAALIQLLDPPGEVTSLKVCPLRPTGSETVYAFGFTAGIMLNPQSGKIGGNILGNRYPMSLAINPGMSGGPVFAASGRVFAMGVTGVHEAGWENYNFAVAAQFLKPALNDAAVSESCPSDSKPAGSGSVDKPKNESLVKVYVDFFSDPSRTLEQYRKILLDEFYRLIAQKRMAITPVSSTSPQDEAILKDIFRQYFEGVPRQAYVKELLRTFVQNMGTNRPDTLYLYLLNLEAVSTSMIKAAPWLLEITFPGDDISIKAEKLSPQSQLLATNFEPSARAQVKKLLLDAAGRKTEKFTRQVIFIDCIDIRVVNPPRVGWLLPAPSALERALTDKWKGIEPYSAYGRQLKAARSESCQDKQAAPDDPEKDDQHMYALAHVTIKPILMRRDDNVYQTAWERTIVGQRHDDYLPVGEVTSLLEAGPFMNLWVDDIHKYFLEGAPK